MTSLALGAALAIGVSPVTMAQAQQQPQQQAPAQSVSDEQLQVFAVALLEVQKVAQEYSPRIQQSQDQGGAQKLQEEAQEKMAEAVQAKGLSVEQYNQMANLVESDPAAREKVVQYMRQ